MAGAEDAREKCRARVEALEADLQSARELLALLEGEQARADRLEAENARLREALKPFADALSRYSRNSHELIALVDDFTGERLNVLHRDCWNRAAALGDT